MHVDPSNAKRRLTTTLRMGAAVMAIGLLAASPNRPAAKQDTKPKSIRTTPRKAAPAKPALAEKPKRTNYTFPITLSGTAKDENGKPISTAKIYLVCRAVRYERIAETTTDKNGRYEFRNVPLPIHRADTNTGFDAGAFEVFGLAEGYGFAWRPSKSFYPKPLPAHIRFTPEPDEPSRFEAGDKIELDLTFPPPATLGGRIVDENGQPIPKTLLSIRYCEPIPAKGYSKGREFRSVMGSLHFESLNARSIVPPKVKTRQTDAQGRFEFTSLPPDCRFQIWVRPPGFPLRRIWGVTGDVKGDLDGYQVHPDGMAVTFALPREVPLRILYGDSGKPAPKVFVNGHSRMASSYETTDKDGEVTLRLPPGSYELNLLPATGTPYLETELHLEVKKAAPEKPLVFQMDPAAVVQVMVVDVGTGKGVSGVRLWREVHYFPEPDRPPRASRRTYDFSSWEVATRIAHVHRPRTDADGKLRALFAPGRHRIGLESDTLPKEYVVVEAAGQEVDCQVGKPAHVTFHIRK